MHCFSWWPNNRSAISGVSWTFNLISCFQVSPDLLFNWFWELYLWNTWKSFLPWTFIFWRVKHMQDPPIFALTGQCTSKAEEMLKHQGEANRRKLREFTYCTIQQKRRWEENARDSRKEKDNPLFQSFIIKKQLKKKPLKETKKQN